MSEKTQVWQPLRDHMKGKWEAQRIEAKIPKGVPDVMYKAKMDRVGWLELKYSTRKAKKGRVQQLPHFTIEQRRWMETWPCSRVLWRIDGDWLLFDQQFELLGHVDFDKLVEISQWHWVGTPNFRVLAGALNVSEPISSGDTFLGNASA